MSKHCPLVSKDFMRKMGKKMQLGSAEGQKTGQTKPVQRSNCPRHLHDVAVTKERSDAKPPSLWGFI